jgi:signal peptidase II
LPQPTDEPVGPPAGAADTATPESPSGLGAADDTVVSGSEAPGEVGPPPPPPAPAGLPPRAGLYWRLVILIVLADQLTKALIRGAIPQYDSVNVIPGLLDFTHVRNEGVAFGLLSNLNLPLMPYLTAALAILALVGIAYYARHVRADERLARLGLSLILGGAIGNLIDRFRQSYVLDFVDVYWGDWHFWAFNVADASITIGAILVFFELLTHRHASHPV